MPTIHPMTSNRLPAWKAMAAALFVALAAVAIVYPGLVTGRQIPISTERFGLSDLTDGNLPLRAWGGAELARGRLPLWFPGCYGGLPLAAIPEAVPYYPPSALFYMVAGPGAATAWTIVLHLLIAGVGGAMVARHFGAGLGGQLLAAVLMSVGLHLPGHVRQLNVLQAEAWAPWAWLFLDRLLKRPGRREVAGLGFSMGMLGLAGHPEILHHAVVLFAVWGAVRLLGSHRQWLEWRFWARRAAALGAAALIAVALAAPHLVPICEMMRWVHRSLGQHSPNLKALAMLVRPMILGDPGQGNAGTFFGPFVWEEMFYIGLLPIALAAGWFLFCRRGRLRVGLFAIGAASLLFAFASTFRLTERISELIPMELSSRYPHRYLWAFNMALVTMAALGFDGLLRAIVRRYRSLFTRRVAIACVSVALIATAFDIAWVSRRLNPMGDSAALVGRPETLNVLAAAGANPNRFAERVSTYGFKPIALRLFDLKPGWASNPAVDIEAHRLLLPEHPTMWNWQLVRGYVGMDPFWTGLMMGDQHMIGVMSNLDGPDGWRVEAMTTRPERYIQWSGFYGGRWMVSPIRLESPMLRAVGEIPGKYFRAYVYENKAWAGGAWISRDLRTFRDDDWLCVDLEEAMPDRNRIRMACYDVPDAAKSDPARGSGDSVGEPQWPDPQHVAVNCRLERPGFLVLNQNYYPDWRVRIDGGAAQPVLRVNVCQTGVWLEAGSHRVVFEYAGWREKACLLLGLIGLGMVAILTWNPVRFFGHRYVG